MGITIKLAGEGCEIFTLWITQFCSKVQLFVLIFKIKCYQSELKKTKYQKRVPTTSTTRREKQEHVQQQHQQQQQPQQQLYLSIDF